MESQNLTSIYVKIKGYYLRHSQIWDTIEMANETDWFLDLELLARNRYQPLDFDENSLYGQAIIKIANYNVVSDEERIIIPSQLALADFHVLYMEELIHNVLRWPRLS